ncbi:MAG: prolyl oligopeptidase family serine peptidase [Myxococcota bacterium]
MTTRTSRPGSRGSLRSTGSAPAPPAPFARLVLVAGIALVSGCAAPPAERPRPSATSGSSPAAAAPVSPGDRLAADFLAHPDYADLALSPDGSRLAAIRSHGDEDQIVVFELDPTPDGPISAPKVVVRERRGERGFEASRSIETLGWAGASHLVYAIETALRSQEDGVARPRGRSLRTSIQRPRGVGTRARKTRLYAADLDGRTRYLAKRWQGAGYSQFQHRIISYLPDDPFHVLIDYERRAVRVDVRNGAQLTVEPAARARDSVWAADHTGAIRAGHSTRGWDRRMALVARPADLDRWQVVSDYDAYSEPGIWFAGFSPDPARIYVFSDLAGDRTTLHEFDLTTNVLGPPIHADATRSADATGLLQSSRDDRLLALVVCGDRCGLEIVDRRLEQAWEKIAADLPDQSVSIVARSADDATWIVEASSDVVPPSIHRFEPATGRHAKLFDLRPALVGRTLAPTKTARFRARDGLVVEAYLTRPVGASGPGPVVVLPHDGPEDRAEWGFDPTVQYLAARGFTVLQPNYRGSTGYGRAFRLSGHREWGGAVLGDVIDAARALVASGIADPARIGIFGTGFGGYLALEALVEAPELFAAGASFGALTDLPALLADDRRFVGRAAVHEKVLLPASGEADGLEAISPAYGAARIRAPILLGHGEQDPRFPEKHADAMASALERAGRPFESIRYEGATGDFLDDRDRIAFYRRLGDFFERHLTGRSVAQRDAPPPASQRPIRP